MQVTEIEIESEGLKRAFKVILPRNEVDQRIEARLKELGESVHIPGFRPGKAPLAVLKTRYGTAVRGEVVEKAVSDGSARAILDRGLRPAVRPTVDIKSDSDGTDLEFTMSLEVLPEIEPMDLSKIKIERLEVEVPDSEVEEATAKLTEQYKRTESVADNRPARVGDIVVIDYHGQVDGKDFPGGRGEHLFLELGRSSLLPGFDDQLVGAKSGSHLHVTTNFPAAHPNKALAGKEALFHVDVTDVRETKVTAADDSFAKQLGHESLEALKGDVRKSVEANYRLMARARVKRHLFDILSNEHDFPLPKSMVDAEFGGVWARVQTARAQGTMDPDDKDKSEEELRAAYGTIAARRVRLGLILSEVGRRNNIAVTDEEVKQAVMAEARRHPGHEQEVVQYYLSNLAAVEAIRAPILEDKVVDFILEKAKAKKRTVTSAELAAMDQAEQQTVGAEDAAGSAESEEESAEKPAKKPKR
ncbi:MAG: trigger factor, partial [Alphaproteobacteria bacterium]